MNDRVKFFKLSCYVIDKLYDILPYSTATALTNRVGRIEYKYWNHLSPLRITVKRIERVMLKGHTLARKLKHRS